MIEKIKSIDELIPQEFKREHEELLNKLRKENRVLFKYIESLTNDNFDDPEWCREHGFSYENHTWSDYYRVMFAHALKEGYIKQ